MNGKAQHSAMNLQKVGTEEGVSNVKSNMASLCKIHISHLQTRTHMVSLSLLSTSSSIFSSPVKSHLPSSRPESANGFVDLSTSFTAAVNLEQCTLSDVQVSFIKQDLWFHPLDLQMGFIVIYACVMKDHI